MAAQPARVGGQGVVRLLPDGRGPRRVVAVVVVLQADHRAAVVDVPADRAERGVVAVPHLKAVRRVVAAGGPDHREVLGDLDVVLGVEIGAGGRSDDVAALVDAGQRDDPGAGDRVGGNGQFAYGLAVHPLLGDAVVHGDDPARRVDVDVHLVAPCDGRGERLGGRGSHLVGEGDRGAVGGARRAAHHQALGADGLDAALVEAGGQRDGVDRVLGAGPVGGQAATLADRESVRAEARHGAPAEPRQGGQEIDGRRAGGRDARRRGRSGGGDQPRQDGSGPRRGRHASHPVSVHDWFPPMVRVICRTASAC